MDFSSIISTFLTMIGALGGLEAIKYFINRKPNARIAEAEADIKETEADKADFGMLKETILFLQDQIKTMAVENAEKEKRFIEQTSRLREVQDREQKVLMEKQDILLQKQALELELQQYKCVRKRCDKREPQNGY